MTKHRSIPLAFIAACLSMPARADAPNYHYKYDVQGRLAQVCTARPGDGELTRYSYDQASNRTSYNNQKVDLALTPESGIFSPDNRFLLWMQSDGNLVLYYRTGPGWSWAPLGWATNTVGSGADIAYFQSDGNLVLYSPSGVVWSTGNGGYPCATLQIANDGNLTIQTTDGAIAWSSNTGGH